MITTLSTFAGMLSTVATAAGITAGGVLAAGAAIAGIALAVVAVGVLIYKNWDTICEYAAKLRDWVVTKWNDLKTNVSNAVTTLKTNVTTTWNNLKTSVINAATSLKTSVVSKFNSIKTGIVNAFTSVKSKVKGVFDWFSKKFAWVTDGISGLKSKAAGLPGVSSALNALGIGENATGTPYWRGGLTKINERGGEIVDLPSGTRIIPHDIAKKQNSGSPSVVVNLVIQGNMIGNREYMEETGEYIAAKLIAAMDIA